MKMGGWWSRGEDGPWLAECDGPKRPRCVLDGADESMKGIGIGVASFHLPYPPKNPKQMGYASSIADFSIKII